MVNALNEFLFEFGKRVVISCSTLERHSCPQRPSEVLETIARLRMCWKARTSHCPGKTGRNNAQLHPSTSRRPPSSPPKSIEIKNSRSTLTILVRYHRYPDILSDTCGGLLVFIRGLAIYKIKHFLLFPPLRVSRAARVADSNTSRTPWLVLAEHSRYL